jgi:hypothetical protein
MPRVSLIKKLKLYSQYRSVVLQNIDELASLNLRVDMVNRLYTVVNVPEELFDGAYDTKSADIVRISKGYITEYIRQVSRTLDGMGLTELYRLYDTKKVDKYSFLVVIGFKLFDTRKAANAILYRALPAALVGSAAIALLAYLRT